MKLTVAILIIGLTHVSAAINAQITIKEKNIPLQTALKSISQQSGYDFIYSDQVFQDAHSVSLNLSNAPIETALNLCFKDQPLTYKIEDKTVMVRRKTISDTKTVANNIANVPQAHDVRIHVTDSTGQPLSGASVTVKGSKQGGSADAQGNIILTGLTGGETLVVAYIGYETKEINIRDRENISVVLNVSTNPLDEMQVIAYGTTTKRFNTGDVTTVKSEDIEKHPVANPLAALQGRVPGMVITQKTGIPGGAFTVQIRGQNSIANGNDPLYIVDGVPYTSQLGYTLGPLVGGSPFSYINPSDIESIDILKDADATAIYGSRGANGVVLITTKKGKSGKMKVDLNVYAGTDKVAHFIDMMNTPQYLEMRREAFKNDGVTPGPLDLDINGTWDTTRYTDWQKKFIGGTAHYTDARASISGGSENVQYLFSGGYHRETTVFPSSGANYKGTSHFNLKAQSPNQKFKATVSADYVADNYNASSFDYTQYMTLAPNAPSLINEDGSYYWPSGGALQYQNPATYALRKFKNNTNNLIANATLSYELAQGLNVKLSSGYNYLQADENLTNPAAGFNPAYNPKGSSQFNSKNFHSWILEPQLTYERKLGKGKLNAVLGSTFQQNNQQAQNLYASGYTNDALLEDIKSASSVSITSTNIAKYKYAAIFARLNYNLSNKYLLNLTARRDGSSRFGPNKQFANFGAIGGGWIFSEEKFFKNRLPFLSYGKIRGSYGTTGNDQITDYRFMDLYQSSVTPYQGNKGLLPNRLFNPELAWELNKKLEAGIELGFLKDRLLATASYYRNRSSNQLLGYRLSAVTGFTSIDANFPATVQNSGWEFTLSTQNVKDTYFSWNTAFNLTLPRNKLVAFPNIETSSYGNSGGLIIGEPVNIIHIYELAGVNPSDGLYQFVNAAGELTETPSYADDRIKTVNTSPKFYGGLENSIKYKSIQLSFLLQYTKQTGRSYFATLPTVAPGYIGVNFPTEIVNRWRQAGDVSDIQRSSKNGSLSYTYSQAQFSDFGYSDASFIRLKNVSLSYSLPKSIIKRLKLENAKIYFQGQNLMTITGYKGLDPETQSMTALPPLRVLTIGLQIGL